MTSPEGSKAPRSKAKLAAEIGGGVVGGVVAGTAGYLTFRKHRLARQRSIEASRATDYEKSLAIFDEPRLDPATKTVMAAVAVRVYHAAELTFDPIITRGKLLELFQDRYGVKFRELYSTDLSKHTLQRALSYLSDYHLIERQSRPENPKSQGYIAAPALTWAMEGEVINEYLVQAEMDLLGDGESFSGNL